MGHIGLDALHVVLAFLTQLAVELLLQCTGEAAQGDKGRFQVVGDGVDESFELPVFGLKIGQQPLPLLLRPLIFINILKCPSKFYYFIAAVNCPSRRPTRILSLLPRGMKSDSRSYGSPVSAGFFTTASTSGLDSGA